MKGQINIGLINVLERIKGMLTVTLLYVCTSVCYVR
jgi:hypothetical protein